MPVDNIPINTSSPQGQDLRALVQACYNARANARRILEQMQEQSNPGGNIYTNLETQFGVPAGQGVNVYGLVFALANGDGSGTGLEIAAIKTFCSRIN